MQVLSIALLLVFTSAYWTCRGIVPLTLLSCAACRSNAKRLFQFSAVVSSWGIARAVGVLKNCDFACPPCRPLFSSDQLGFNSFEEGLDSRIIETATFAAHSLPGNGLDIGLQPVARLDVMTPVQRH